MYELELKIINYKNKILSEISEYRPFAAEIIFNIKQTHIIGHSELNSKSFIINQRMYGYNISELYKEFYVIVR